jgi:hypothetical protein
MLIDLVCGLDIFPRGTWSKICEKIVQFMMDVSHEKVCYDYCFYLLPMPKCGRRLSISHRRIFYLGNR